MAKRIIKRIWAQKRRGGFVLPRFNLLEALRTGQIMEMGGIQIGARDFRALLMAVPKEDDFRIAVNGRLEIETLERVSKRQPDGSLRTGYRKPKEYYQFTIVPGAWLPLNEPAKLAGMTTVVIKPLKLKARKE